MVSERAGPDPSEPADHPQMTVLVHEQGAAVVVEVSGEVDMVTAPQFQQTLQQVLDDTPAVLIVDLAAVTFFGSAGLAALVAARQTTQHQTTQHQSQLRLVAQDAAVVRPLQVTGLDGLFCLYATRVAAVAEA